MGVEQTAQYFAVQLMLCALQMKEHRGFSTHCRVFTANLEGVGQMAKVWVFALTGTPAGSGKLVKKNTIF